MYKGRIACALCGTPVVSRTVDKNEQYIDKGGVVFTVDPRILASAAVLWNGNLSQIFLKNESNFPWLILVPRVVEAREMFQLSRQQQIELMGEIDFFSRIISQYFQPDKLNVGALGNIVPQLHIHIVGRFQQDIAWPHSVWQSHIPSLPYEPKELAALIVSLRQLIQNSLSE